MAFGTQELPWALQGTLAERPPAARVPEGYTYLATDVGIKYTLVIAPATMVRTWVSTGAGGLPSEDAFGDGSDLDIVVNAGNSPYVLTRDFFPRSLHVTATGVYRPGQFGTWGQHSILIDAGGIVEMNGNDAVADVGGAALPNGTFRGGASGGNGAVNGVGSIGSTDPLTGMVTPVGGNGGDAGAGGANAGGLGGVQVTSPTMGSLHRFDSLIRGRDVGEVLGGAGGGGGGSNNALATGGGGGGGAGYGYFAAPSIINNGTVRAIGGAGADGTAAAGAAGGGGGGGGGDIVMVGNSVTPGVTSVLGGAGGLGAGGGVVGADGLDGTLKVATI